MSLEVQPYQLTDAAAWDKFCDNALQATFLHSRRFLSYHGNRFDDQSLIILNNGKWVGVFPAALLPDDKTCVMSHPGITYGGILHQGALMGKEMILALQQIQQYYASQGYLRLVYKVVPIIYHKIPANDDSYAIFRLGGKRIRCDLSSTIDLGHRLSLNDRRKRSFKKAMKAGVELREGLDLLPEFFSILQDNLARKHSVRPVHSLEELTMLANLFPNNIQCIGGFLNKSIIAGILLFSTATCTHAQYIASSEVGYAVSALDPIFEYAINKARDDNKRWFDFGISNEMAGMILNEGLYQYKSEFGGGGILHEFFELDLGMSNKT